MGTRDNEMRSLPGRKLYQDEIYGSRELSPLAVVLMDTPEFQRLGHIYQLGMTYTLFRGANHRRFDHSVGTHFMSRRLMERIVENHGRLFPCGEALSSLFERWGGLTELVSAAALLHDLGHIPVGHTLEDEFSLFEKHDGLGGSRLFELLYGPRLPEPAKRPGSILDKYFGPIDEERLPSPEPCEMRVALPWIFEDGIFQRFIPGTDFSNREVRDLIYLMLSFTETVTEEERTTFPEELEKAKENGRNDGAKRARLRFIEELYDFHTSSGAFHPFMSEVVCSTICADLLDYLARDGRRLHLEIRTNPRLERYMVIRPESPKGALRLTINAVYRNGLQRRDTMSELLDLMRERYRCAEVVYYHPKKCAFSAMFAKALELSPFPPRDGEDLYPAPWSGPGEVATPHVAHFGDESLLAFLAQKPKEPLSKEQEKRFVRAEALVRRIRYRDEYRLLFTLDYGTAERARGAAMIIEDLRRGRDQGRREFERAVGEMVQGSPLASVLGSEPPILVYCPNLQMQVKEVAARVELVPDHVIPLNRQKDNPVLEHEIRILNEKYRTLWRLYLFANPRLAALGEAVPLLNRVIDAFCDQYGVRQEDRRRGSRIGEG